MFKGQASLFCLVLSAMSGKQISVDSLFGRQTNQEEMDDADKFLEEEFNG